MKLLERLEYWHNKVSDTKFVWFPFNFLKPMAQSEIEMTLKLKMALCFGFYYGVFAAIRTWIFTDSNFGLLLVRDIFLAIVIFVVWFNVVTAPLWNIRARRLKKITQTQ